MEVLRQSRQRRMSIQSCSFRHDLVGVCSFRFLRALALGLLLLTLHGPMEAQSQTQSWPEIDTYLTLTSDVRVSYFAAATWEGRQGMVTNSGVMPGPGLTYSDTFLTYSFDQLVGPDGQTITRAPSVGVTIDVNVFFYVFKKKILGGNLGMAAGLPISNSSISSIHLGAIAGGAGFADSFYQPLTMGWHLKRADITAAYAFFAPTGRFTPGATNNTGTGY